VIPHTLGRNVGETTALWVVETIPPIAQLLEVPGDCCALIFRDGVDVGEPTRGETDGGFWLDVPCGTDRREVRACP
jgi:hypothetical protein